MLSCRHELAGGAYGLTPFLVSKLAIGLPLEAALVAAAGSLLYVLLGLQAGAAQFGSFLALSVLCALCASNCGNLLGLVLPGLNAALPALCVGATLLLAFAGFIGEGPRLGGAGRRAQRGHALPAKLCCGLAVPVGACVSIMGHASATQHHKSKH